MKNNKNKRLLIILGVIIVLAFIGLTYAYFVGKVTSSGGNVTAISKDIKLTFSDNDTINVSNIEPGWSTIKTISVQNTGSNAVTYDIVWTNITNNFIDKSDLVYSSTCTGSGCKTLSETEIPWSGTNQIVSEYITIPANTTQTYTITFRFLETNKVQDLNLYKTLNGRLGLKISDKGYDQTNYLTSSFEQGAIYGDGTLSVAADSAHAEVVRSAGYSELTPGTYMLTFPSTLKVMPRFFEENNVYNTFLSYYEWNTGKYEFTITENMKIKFIFKKIAGGNLLPSEISKVRLIKKSNIKISEPDTSKYVTNTLGYNLTNNVSFLSNSVLDFTKNTVTQTTYNSLPLTGSDYELIKDDAIVQSGLVKAYGDDGFYTYIYRGPESTKYVSINGRVGRVTRINEDGTIRVALPDSTFIYKEFDGLNYSTMVNGEEVSSDLKKAINNYYVEELNEYDNIYAYGSFCNDRRVFIQFSVDSMYKDFLFYEVSMESKIIDFDDFESIFAADNPPIVRSDYATDREYFSAIYGDENDEMNSIIFYNPLKSFGIVELVNNYQSLQCDAGDKVIEKIGLINLNEMMMAGYSLKNNKRLTDSSLMPFENTISISNSYNDEIFYLFNFIHSVNENDFNTTNVNDEIALNLFVNLKQDVRVTSGLGTSASPYIIDLS